MNKVHALATGDASLYHARVVSRHDVMLTVAYGTLHLRCLRAAGCLLVPEPGDLVLVCASEHDAYVIAVLAQMASDMPREVVFEGDTRLRVNDGSLEVGADHGVEMIAGERYKVTADRAELSFRTAEMHCESYLASGESNLQQWTRIHELADQRWSGVREERLEVIDRVVRVAAHDQLEAGSVAQRIEEDWSVSAADVSMKADQCVAIDATGYIALG
ncbi:DUF3540 domain-containing protein [Paraburkholderia sediminicola]|uniref:DUF3540 domain-containing protein n=1 Tax=Paraburkholderia sediminicola TaxID=458836 RepID=UPI0038BA1F6D